MRNNILREDLDAMIEHLKQDDPILTNGPNCRKFEEEWSEWLGVKYSVFVNSGASANLLSMTALKIMHPYGGEVIVPPLTWISDVASVIQCGFKPVFVDIDLNTLGMNTDKIIAAITPQTKAVFLSHIQGYNAITDKLIYELEKRNIPLIEDVCESHGATYKGKKCGSIGWMSNFSFYYAHHMTTIEGGMISTNDKNLYHTLRMLRSHGMVRECDSQELKQNYIENNFDLNPDFIFSYAAYNMRNNELGGILGRKQLPRLDENVKVRNYNNHRLLSKLNDNYFTEFNLEGQSNYAFNIVLKNKDDDFMNRLSTKLRESGVEFRRGSAGGGNQLRQPYLKDVVNVDLKDFPNTEHVHFYGLYIGNFPTMEKQEVDEIVNILNGV